MGRKRRQKKSAGVHAPPARQPVSAQRPAYRSPALRDNLGRESGGFGFVWFFFFFLNLFFSFPFPPLLSLLFFSLPSCCPHPRPPHAAALVTARQEWPPEGKTSITKRVFAGKKRRGQPQSRGRRRSGTEASSLPQKIHLKMPPKPQPQLHSFSCPISLPAALGPFSFCGTKLRRNSSQSGLYTPWPGSVRAAHVALHAPSIGTHASCRAELHRHHLLSCLQPSLASLSKLNPFSFAAQTFVLWGGKGGCFPSCLHAGPTRSQRFHPLSCFGRRDGTPHCSVIREPRSARRGNRFFISPNDISREGKINLPTHKPFFKL